MDIKRTRSSRRVLLFVSPGAGAPLNSSFFVFQFRAAEPEKRARGRERSERDPSEVKHSNFSGCPSPNLNVRAASLIWEDSLSAFVRSLRSLARPLSLAFYFIAADFENVNPDLTGPARARSTLVGYFSFSALSLDTRLVHAGPLTRKRMRERVRGGRWKAWGSSFG